MIISDKGKEKTGHEARPHAPCSASGSSRWLNCPGSVGLSVGIKSKPSSYAEEGTKAHELSEKYLRAWLDNQAINIECDDSEMHKHVSDYVSFVVKKSKEFKEKPNIRIESQLTLNKEMVMYGTADVAMTGKLKDESHGKIIDFKYGKTPVVAKENSQLAYYAVALMLTSKQALTSVEVNIFQPRAKKTTTSIFYTREELLCWHGVLFRGAEKALWQVIYEKDREYKMGEWCKYCLAKTICPEFNKAAAEGEGQEFIDL